MLVPCLPTAKGGGGIGGGGGSMARMAREPDDAACDTRPCPRCLAAATPDPWLAVSSP